ncbi:MAG TPA: sugar ABC transporter substrate-binding protein [Streptosporangiaceae bacterium]|nr:sugar ABC transporter substrate-binding protein [Streptosporangiaceae bacterium]
MGLEMLRVLYVSPMPYGANAAVDAISHGIDHRLAGSGAELRVAYADFADPGWRDLADRAVRAGPDAGFDAIVIWVIDPATPGDAVRYARAGGVPVVSLERPRFAVDASVVYPNFNHGVYMAEYLATLVPPGARVAVVGGPDVVDDIELMLGIMHGIEISGMTRVNDPEDPRYKNTTDVASGGREKTANLLADFASLDALIPFNDETLLGAVEALRAAGRLGEVKMVSRNGTPAAVELVRAGLHHGTWDIDPLGIGQTIAGLAVRAASGEALDGLCLSSPIGRMITRERAAAWVPWQERIPYNSLETFKP